MWSLSLVMCECSLSGRGQGHVSNFYIVDLEISPQQVFCIQVIYTTRPSSVCLWHLRRWEPTRSRHGWVHIVHDTLPPTKPPTSYHQFGLDLRGNWQDYYWQDASRGHSAIVELLVLITYYISAVLHSHCPLQRLNFYWHRKWHGPSTRVYKNFSLAVNFFLAPIKSWLVPIHH